MQQNHFSELIAKIDKLLVEPNITKTNKKKLSKAKAYLLSNDTIDWEKGINILGKVITGAGTLYKIFESIWDWLKNLF